VDVTLRFAEVFRSVLSGVGGSTGGCRCCWGAPSQLPPATTKNPLPTLICCFCVFAAVGVTCTRSGRLEVNLSLAEKRGGKSHLGTIPLSVVSGIWRFCMVNRSLLPVQGATNTASGRLEVKLLFLSEKRGGKSHLGIVLVAAKSGI